MFGCNFSGVVIVILKHAEIDITKLDFPIAEVVEELIKISSVFVVWCCAVRTRSAQLHHFCLTAFFAFAMGRA